IPAVSKLNGFDSWTSFCRLAIKGSSLTPSGRNTMPGLVQNCPAPIVKDACSPLAMASEFSRSAPGKIKTGLVLLISANTGMGSGRVAATSMRVLPPLRDPVNPTAFTSGCLTSAIPTLLPESNRSVQLAHQLTGPGVRRMRFHNHRIARRERGCRVPARYRKCQWKVARSKNSDRPQGMKHGPQIGFGNRFAIWIRTIDSGHDPRTLFHHFREQAKLTGGARSFTDQARFR